MSSQNLQEAELSELPLMPKQLKWVTDQELSVYYLTFSKRNFYLWMMMRKCTIFVIFRTNYDFRGEGVRKPLLKKLDEVKPPTLEYLGTSFGFTQQLLKFWRKNGYQPVYLRQTVNDITA